MEQSFDLGRLLRNHQKIHKSKPSQFGSVAGGVKKRFENNLNHRKSNRLTCFDNIRDLPKCESPVPVSKVQSKEEHRRQQLEKWKEQKEKQKKVAAAQKKKPFVAGVARAPLTFVPPPPIQKPKPSTSGRVTRSQTSKIDAKSKETKASNLSLPTPESFAPKNASFRPPEMKNVTSLPQLGPVKSKKDKKQHITFDPILPNVQKESKQSRSRAAKPVVAETKLVRKQTERTAKAKVTKSTPKKTKVVKAALQSSSSSEKEQTVTNVSPALKSRSSRKSMAAPKSPVIKTPRKSMSVDPEPAQPTFLKTPKNPVPKSESKSEERLRSPKSMENAVQCMTPEQITEEAKKISPCVTISRGKDNARKEMKKKLHEGLLDEDASDIDCVDHFRKQLASEVKRITEMCETWEKISQQNILPESVQEAVLSAVGQARLLMSQKLQQFAALVEACARPEPGLALVTPADLHGFWDMVFMQVENVDVRFKNLEELRARGWVELEPVAIKKKVVRGPAKKATKPSGVPSQLREMIAAARKAKKEKQDEPSVTLAPQAAGDSKTFEAGFFSVRSPVKSPAISSPAQGTPGSKSSLLKAVLSNEAKKSASKSSASFAMLRASVMGKNMEYEGIAPIPQTPINLYATPGRSILKPTNTDKKSARKSIKVVLFDHSDAESHDNSYRTPDSELNEVEPDEHPDSGISSMDLEKVENKENSRRKSRLVRQDAEDRSPVLTRSRRKSVADDAVTPRRSSRKKVLQESEENVEDKIPPRSSRRRKSQAAN